VSATVNANDGGAGPWLRVDPTSDGLRIAGELVHGTCGALEERLRSLDTPELDQSIVIDVAGVTFCDSSGLSTLIGAHRRARRAGAHITLTGATGPLARLLDLSGIGGLFAGETGAQSESG
jgi:anti-sigma B factor antagonist